MIYKNNLNEIPVITDAAMIQRGGGGGSTAVIIVTVLCIVVGIIVVIVLLTRKKEMIDADFFYKKIRLVFSVCLLLILP